MIKKNILIIAAHPDDEILGCGGSASRFVREGYDISTLILGEGITSRDLRRDACKRENNILEIKKQITDANKLIGVNKVYALNYPDNRFDTVPMLDLVKEIEKIKDELKPTTIFTHYKGDLNIDHRITSTAVLTATRPLPSENLEEIYFFEILSSTEWNYSSNFRPNLFIEISEEDLSKKLSAMGVYTGELRNYPHPRSLEGIKVSAKYRGMGVGKKYCESFQIARSVKPILNNPLKHR
jgi:LmbE family N-acetylglucosaminyl deacetylase